MDITLFQRCKKLVEHYIIYRAGSKQSSPYANYEDYLEIYDNRTFSDELEVLRILEQLRAGCSWDWKKMKIHIDKQE